MEFEWDERKNRSNLEKHHIDFRDAISIFEGDVLAAPDHRKSYGEERTIAIGLMEGIEIVLVYTERRERIRIISARRANRHERENYKNRIAQCKARRN